MYYNQMDIMNQPSPSPSSSSSLSLSLTSKEDTLVDHINMNSPFKSLSNNDTTVATSSTVTRKRKRKKPSTMIIKPARWIAPAIIPNHHCNNGLINKENALVTSSSEIDFKPTFYNPNEIKHRKRISTVQCEILESEYEKNTKPNASKRYQLAHQLGMTPRTVQIWFQNKRAKTKQYEQKKLNVNHINNHSHNTSSDTINDSDHSIFTSSFDDGRFEPIYLMDYDSSSSPLLHTDKSSSSSLLSSPILLPQDNNNNNNNNDNNYNDNNNDLSSSMIMNHETLIEKIATPPSLSTSVSCSSLSTIQSNNSTMMIPPSSSSSLSSLSSSLKEKDKMEFNQQQYSSVCSSPQFDIFPHDDVLFSPTPSFNMKSFPSMESHDNENMHYLNWIRKTTNFYPTDIMYSDNQILHDDMLFMMNDPNNMNNNDWMN
ncbi:unnamed protein product [Cunninghamella blakesleeana]